MIDQVAIPPQRISTMGFGKYRPAHSNASPEGREKNRRVEIILTAKPQPGNTILESIPPSN